MEWLSGYLWDSSSGAQATDRQNASDLYDAKNTNIAQSIAPAAPRRMRPPLQLAMLKFSKILHEDTVKILYSYLPPEVRDDSYTLAFATHRDGWNLGTLGQCVGRRSPTIVVVKTLESGTVMGCFLRTALGPANQQFKGDGTSFIFRLGDAASSVCYRCPVQAESKALSAAQLGTAAEYAFLSTEYLAVGGSADRGTNAIRLFSDLMLCSAGPSDTYNNDGSLAPLERNPVFKTAEVEVYCGSS